MDGAAVILVITWVFVAVLLVIQPWFTRRNVLFGVVFATDDIWKEKRAKKTRVRYLLAMTAGSVLISLGVLGWCLAAKLSVAASVVPYLVGITALLVYGTIVFIIYHAKTLELKSETGRNTGMTRNRISVETSAPDSETVVSAAWLWLLLPIVLAVWGVAIFGYSAMPERIPTHYSFTAADAWAPKSWMIVLFPALMATAIGVMLLIGCLFTRRAPASVRGNPEAAPEAFRFRKYMIYLMLILGVFAEATFLLIEIGSLKALPPLLFELPVLPDLAVTVALFVIYFRFVRVSEPKGPILDDDAKWVLGMFYYNPSDPSTFVEKRTGIGYTINFARPGGLILMIAIVIFLIVTLVFSFRT